MRRKRNPRRMPSIATQRAAYLMLVRNRINMIDYLRGIGAGR